MAATGATHPAGSAGRAPPPWGRGENLRVVKVREPLCREALWQLALDDHVLYLVAEQFVVNIPRHRGLVHGKRLQRALHPGRKAQGWHCAHLRDQCEACPSGTGRTTWMAQVVVAVPTSGDYKADMAAPAGEDGCTCQMRWTSTRNPLGSYESPPQVHPHCSAAQWRSHRHNLCH